MNALDLFQNEIRQWFVSKYSEPTDVQQAAWQAIARGEHVFVTAPTGSGKTLTAFLWALNQLVSGRWPRQQLSVIYVSPLKALNNDISVNLARPLAEIRSLFAEGLCPEIHVHVRSGDTPQNERRKILSHQPEILITTPESLNILLTSSSAKHLFAGVRSVILDEIHHVAPTKRGTHLMSAVERLTLYAGNFQRIALSATVRPAERVAAFVAGYERAGESLSPRPITMIRSSINKHYDISVQTASEGVDEGDGTLEALAGHFSAIINKNRSTLIFANSRRMVEKIARFMNEKAGELVAFSHHGSLSREIRASVEKRLRDGELKALVATNSLELGIDVGAVDEVLLLQTPLSLSSTAQRIGRAGHRVGEVSRAALFPTHGTDSLFAAVAAQCVMNAEIEPLSIPEHPLDILAQILLSMCMTRDWDVDELYLFLRTCASYHNLPRRAYDLVLDMLAGSYAGARIRELEPKISIDRVRNSITVLVSPWQLYMSGGTIPNRGLFTMRLESGEKIGELDEEFVWERNIGDTFTLGVQTWRITGISASDVVVSFVDKPPGIVPFWRGEPVNRDAFVSEKIREKLSLANRLEPGEFGAHLTNECAMTREAAIGLVEYLSSQKKATGTDLPDIASIVIEHCEGLSPDTREVILHTFWGGRVNRPLAIALSAMWAEKFGYRLECFADNDAILIHLLHEFSSADIIALLDRERTLSYVRKGLEASGLFGAHFRENAGRALLLPSMGLKARMPLWMTRLKSRKLFEAVSRFSDFPVTLETWRSCLADEFDLESLGRLLDEVVTGAISIRECHTKEPSPFCAGLVWQQTNKYMYEDDTPRGAKKGALSDSLINEIIASDVMRPLIPAKEVALFDRKLASLDEGYALFDWEDYLRQRIFLDAGEFEAVREAVLRDTGTDISADSTFLASCHGMIAHRETVSLLSAFENQQEDAVDGISVGADHFIRQWLSFHSLVPLDYVRELWSGFCDLDILLDSWREQGTLIIAPLLEADDRLYIALTGNLEAFYRYLRLLRRPQIAARSALSLQNDLARFHRCGQRGTSEDVKRLIERLAGYAANVSYFEEICFPSRMKSYDTMWLDSLFQSTSLMVLGAGAGRMRFSFWGEHELYTKAQDEDCDLNPLFTEEEFVSNRGPESRERLWQLFDEGSIVPDSFVPLRSRIIGGYENTTASPMRRRSWERYNKNVWRRVHAHPAASAEEIFEQKKDIVRQLFLRYGLVSYKTFDADNDGISWKEALTVLRVMELSGEIVNGHFYEGLGLQFCSHEYLRFLREGEIELLFWLNARDCISLCGRDIEGLKQHLPARRGSNYYVMKGCSVILIAEQSLKVLTIHVSPEEIEAETLSLFYDILNRSFNAPKSLRVKEINGQKAGLSPYMSVFVQNGFRREADDLVIERRC